MIRDLLIPRLQQRYPDRGLTTNLADNPIAVFAATQPAVGKVTIWDDGHEATLAVGQISHGHFSVYDSTITDELAVHQKVCEFVIDFLDALFADQVLLWVSDDGQSGGWQRLDLSPDITPPEPGGHFYVWSGEKRSEV